MKAFPILAAIFSLGMATAAVAQSVSQDAPQSPLIEVVGPAHLGAEAPPLAMGSDIESRNVLVAGFSLGAAYDTRGLYNSKTNKFSGDERYFVQPSVAFQRTFSEGAWTLSYTPGFSYSPNDVDNNQYTQNFAGDIVWKPNSRVQVHARQDYSLTDNPFETVGRVDLLPGLGGPLGPNYNGIIPDTRRTSVVSNLDVSYAVAEHSAIGFTGGFQKYDYSSTQTATSSISYENSEVINGSVFYSHQFLRELTAGVQVAYSDYYSTGLDTSRTQAPAPMLFVKLLPNQSTEITLYGGGQYARTSERFAVSSVTIAEPLQTNWYPTFGGTVAWSHRRQAFDATADERISNGGGVLAAVRSINAGGGYRVRLAQRLLAEARVNYGDEKALGSYSKGDYLRSVWAGGGPVIDINRSWSVRGDVAYVHQEEFGLGQVAGNHLLVQGSLDFRFKKNLGE